MSDAAQPLIGSGGVSTSSLYGTTGSAAAAPRRIPKSAYLNAFIQLLLLISAQGLRQFYYAGSFASELAQNGIITKEHSSSPWWLHGFVIPDVFIRTLTVLASRLPSIVRDAKHDASLDQRVTDHLIAQLLSGIEGAVNYDREEHHYDDRASKEATQITGLKTLDAKTNPDVISQHPIALSFAKIFGLSDAFFAIPSTIFFMVGLHQKCRPHDKAPLEILIVVALGAVIGISGAKSYISYRLPRSVYRNPPLLAEIWKHRHNDALKINWPEFKKALRWSTYIAVTQGVFTYFSGNNMMKEFISWACEQTGAKSENWQYFGSAVAVYCALVCAHTNFHNKMTTALPKFVKKDPAPVEVVVAAAAVAPPEPESYWKRDAAVASTKGIGGLSTALDYPLTIMTFLFLCRLFYNPDKNPEVLWTTLAVTALFLWPINKFTYDYTIGEAARGVYKWMTPSVAR